MEEINKTAPNATMIIADVKSAVEGLAKSELTSRQAVSKMTAMFVRMGEAYVDNADVREALNKELAAFGQKPVPLGQKGADGKEQNVFLPLMKIQGGYWKAERDNRDEPKKDKNGKIIQKWVHDRKFESYASVINFFINNGISWKDVEDILNGEQTISIELDGADKPYEVEPTIKAIIAANTLQRNAGKGSDSKGWTDTARSNAKALQPLATFKLSAKQETALSWAKDGYTIAILRRGKDVIEVLGDTGMAEDAVLARVRSRTEKMKEAYAATINKSDKAA